MKIEIKSSYDSTKILFTCDAESVDADLPGAYLQGADLQVIRDDIFAVLSAAPHEVQGLLTALKEGRVDGSTYEGDCACLVGTLAKVKGCEYGEIKGLKPDGSRPAERFFIGIKRGDTPATSQCSKLAEEWVNDWLQRMEAAFKPTDAEGRGDAV